MLRELYNPRYYTLDSIPGYRLDYINLRLHWFIELFSLDNNAWPLDCTHILRKMKELQLISFDYGFFHLPEKYDAITAYVPSNDVYLMQINKNKVCYPFQMSSHRRLNFTLAHEIGHVVLDHLLTQNSALQSELYEREADEFAGRLLMPKELIFSCNYYSLDLVAEYMNVSKTALWMRLNNMKRLDLLSSRKIRTCPDCGNTVFNAFSEYCGICGGPIRKGLKGIYIAFYPNEIKMDQYKRALECPCCHSDLRHITGDRCPLCRTSIFNLCTGNFDGSCNHANPGNFRYCEFCGKETDYFRRRILKSATIIDIQEHDV